MPSSFDAGPNRGLSRALRNAMRENTATAQPIRSGAVGMAWVYRRARLNNVGQTSIHASSDVERVIAVTPHRRPVVIAVAGPGRRENSTSASVDAANSGT